MRLRLSLIVGLITILIAFTALAPGQAKTGLASGRSYQDEIQRWRARRLEELKGEGGWLSLVGLFWLNPGRNTFGSASSNDIALPRNRSPRFAGSLWLENGAVRLEASPGSRITHNDSRVQNLDLHPDADGKQTVLRLGSLTLYVIKRGERFGLRVKDARSPARFHFAGIDHFPVDLNWRVEARFERYDPPRMISIVNVLGMVEKMVSPGVLVFSLGGETYRLEPVLEKGEDRLFVIFADETTGKETYGAGRYLYADPAGPDGKVILDFNRAYNPPCAYTRFATCPLPPPQNRLPIRVEAGEKKYLGKH